MRGERSELLLIFLRRPAADQHQELSRRDGASHLSLLVQRTLAQRNTPRLRARRVAPGPRSRRDFPRGHPALAENAAHPCAAPLRGLVRRLRRYGGATSVKIKLKGNGHGNGSGTVRRPRQLGNTLGRERV